MAMLNNQMVIDIWEQFFIFQTLYEEVGENLWSGHVFESIRKRCNIEIVNNFEFKNPMWSKSAFYRATLYNWPNGFSVF